MAPPFLERFTRFGSQTSAHYIGPAGPSLFIFSGKSPYEVRILFELVFLLNTRVYDWMRESNLQLQMLEVIP